METGEIKIKPRIKKIHFDMNKKLTVKQKQSIAAKTNGALRTNKTIDIIQLFQACLVTDKNEVEFDRTPSSLLKCPGTTKRISKHRALGGVMDCFKGADEQYVNTCQWNHKHRFKCPSEDKYISHILIRNSRKDCRENEDEISLFAPQITF